MKDIDFLRFILEEYGKVPEEVSRGQLYSYLEQVCLDSRKSLADRIRKAMSQIYLWLTDNQRHIACVIPGIPCLVPTGSDRLVWELVRTTLSYNSPQKADCVLTVLNELNDKFGGEFQPQEAHLRQGLKAMNARMLDGCPEDDARDTASAASSTFAQTVTRPEMAEKVTAMLHESMQGRTGAKDITKPIRAAMDAGVIRRPTWREFCDEFGARRITSRSLFSTYTNENYSYCGEDFDRLVEEFRRTVP